MQPSHAAGWNGALDGLAGQLVVEDEAAATAGKQAGAVQPAQGGKADRELGKHAVVQPVRCRCHQLEDLEVLLGYLARVGEDRVSYRLGERTVRLPGDLHDEERVAPGHAVDLLGVEVGVGDQLPYRVDRQRIQMERGQPLDPGEVFEQGSRRMAGSHLAVAVAEQHHQWRRLDPAAEEAEHVHRGRVDPVQVLNDQDGRLGSEERRRRSRTTRRAERLRRGRRDRVQAARQCRGAVRGDAACSVGRSGRAGPGSRAPRRTPRRGAPTSQLQLRRRRPGPSPDRLAHREVRHARRRARGSVRAEAPADRKTGSRRCPWSRRPGRGHASAVCGPNSLATSATTLTGKPPRRPCSRIVSTSSVSWTQ